MVLSQKRKTIVPVLLKVLIKATYQNISKPLSPSFEGFSRNGALFFHHPTGLYMHNYVIRVFPKASVC